MNHFTNKVGYDAIGSQASWCFKAFKPPAGHPTGAYFTTLAFDTPNVSVRLRIPREKLAFVFQFQDQGDLEPLSGGRGAYVFYSRSDYVVTQDRQEYKGAFAL